MNTWLIGTGAMAQNYTKVLVSLNHPFRVIGRSAITSAKFEEATGIKVHRNNLIDSLLTEVPDKAIVAVGVEQLADISLKLILAGTKSILIEKPGGLNSKEILDLKIAAEKNNAEVFIAYNRRFYASTSLARKIIDEDGGAVSCFFEFTEWSSAIANLPISSDLKNSWFLANSSHVVDLAFHLCGIPKDWNAWILGSMPWHLSAARYCGAGITDQNVLFSYHADWEAPGRWGLEVLTRSKRLIFRPLEKLQIIRDGVLQPESINLDDILDNEYKPGLYEQTKAFLNKKYNFLNSISHQAKVCPIYEKIAGYTPYCK